MYIWYHNHTQSNVFFSFQGFWRLDHTNDPFIMRTLRDLVICYLPRLTTHQTTLTTPSSLGASRLFAKQQQQQQQTQKHPILSCLGDDNVPLSRFNYETIANNFLAIRSTVTHPQILIVNIYIYRKNSIDCFGYKYESFIKKKNILKTFI